MFAPGSLDLASSLHNLALSADERGDLATAEDLYSLSLALREEQVPDGAEVALSLNNIGAVLESRNLFEAARAHHERALAIRERLAPESGEVADSLTNLGNLAARVGDYVSAEKRLRRAYQIRVRANPEGAEVAASLNNLGLMAAYRGDLARAEELYRQALEIKERLGPGSLDVARTLGNLAVVASDRGDVEASLDLHGRMLAIVEKIAPESPLVGAILSNLGNEAKAAGDLDRAEQLHLRSLALGRALGGEGVGVAGDLTNLASVAEAKGDRERATALLRQACSIYERTAPRSVDSAAALTSLGRIACASGDFEEAGRALSESLAIRGEFAPGSEGEAESAFEYALFLRATGHPGEALCALERAIAATEMQAERLGGTDETAIDFRAAHLDRYREAIDLSIEIGDVEKAFAISERSRARQLLELLSGRDLDFGADIPEALERERRAAAAGYERALESLREISPSDETKVRRTRLAVEDARRIRDEATRRIRAASSRLGDLRDPEPLDGRAAALALDPGVLLLSWSLGAEARRETGASVLFALSREGGLEAFRLGEEAAAGTIRKQVARLRALVERGREEDLPRISSLAEQLSRSLLGPAKGRIAKAKRLLLAADGPLHFLPFAILPEPTGIGSGEPVIAPKGDQIPANAPRPRLLIESCAVTSVSSATVFAELARTRRGDRPRRLEAFGDPAMASPLHVAGDASSADRFAARQRLLLPQLPASREEVAAIARIYRGEAVVRLGVDATEPAARAIGREATDLHFACHGIVDERFPLESALVLSAAPVESAGDATAGGADRDGLLEAWEIFESIRLDADLVTLSACSTALGKESGGEGIVGLTRAFQYAGARSVLASLWNVADESTAELMQLFHERMAEGKSKDEALRQAQLDFSQRRDPLRHPFYWAAFTLYGDWK